MDNCLLKIDFISVKSYQLWIRLLIFTYVRSGSFTAELVARRQGYSPVFSSPLIKLSWREMCGVKIKYCLETYFVLLRVEMTASRSHHHVRDKAQWESYYTTTVCKFYCNFFHHLLTGTKRYLILMIHNVV